MPGDNVVLVVGALAHAGDKALPYSRLSPGTQKMALSIPAVEIADDGDLLSAGRPYGKIGPGRTCRGYEMSPQLFMELKVAALVEEVKILFGEKRCRAGNFRCPRFCAFFLRHDSRPYSLLYQPVKLSRRSWSVSSQIFNGLRSGVFRHPVQSVPL